MTVKELIKFGEFNKNIGACLNIKNTDIILYIGMNILDLKLSIGEKFSLVKDEFESDCMRLVQRNSGVAVARVKLVSDYIQAIWFTDSIVLNNNLCSKFEDVLLYYNGRMNNLCNVIDGNRLYCRTIASNSKLLRLPVTNINDDNEQDSAIDTVSKNIDNIVSNKHLSDIMDSYKKYERSLNHLLSLAGYCNQSYVYAIDLINNGMLDFNVNTARFSLRYSDVSQWLEGFRIQYGWVVASSESEAALWYLNADSVFKLLNGVVNPVYGCLAYNNDVLKKALAKKGYNVILADDDSMCKVYTNYFNIERSSSIRIEDYYMDCCMRYPDFYRGILGDLSRTTSKSNRGSMSLFLTPDNMLPLYPIMISSDNSYKVSNLFSEARNFSYNSPVGFGDRNGAESARNQYLKERRQFFSTLDYYKGQNMNLGLLYRLKGNLLSGK